MDTREQDSYGPLFRTPYVVQTLSEGDYSVCGLEDRISIERKSLSDLISSLTFHRTRFEKEFQRARSLEYFAVVVEARASDILDGRFHDFSQANPQAIFESIMSWSVRYGRPFFFCETRAIGARTVESLLRKFCRQFYKSIESIEKAARQLRSA